MTNKLRIKHTKINKYIFFFVKRFLETLQRLKKTNKQKKQKQRKTNTNKIVNQI